MPEGSMKSTSLFVTLTLFTLLGCGQPSSSLQPPEGALLTGRVTLEGLGGCEGVTVEVSGEKKSIHSSTGLDGTFSLAGFPVGLYHLSITAPGYDPYEQDLVIYNSRLPRDLGTLELKRVRREMAGEVTTATEESPEGATVVVESQEQITPPAGVRCGSEGFAQLFPHRDEYRVDRNGRWKGKVPSAGSYRGWVRKPGYTEEEFSLTASATPDLPATLPVQAPRVTLYPLTGFVNVLGGQVQRSPLISLQVSAFNGVSEMALGEEKNGVCSFGDWVPYNATPQLLLSNEQGWHRVCVKVRNRRNQELLLTTEVFLDTLPPTGIVRIQRDREALTSESVVLELLAEDSGGSGLEGMKIANTVGELTASPVVPFEWFKLWVLASVSEGSEAARTVYIQFLDRAGNFSPPVSDIVLVDKLPPTGSLSPATVETRSPVLTLNFTYSGDVREMKLSIDSGCGGGSYQAVTSAAQVYFTSEGVHAVEVQFQDRAGNRSICYSQLVTFDATPPEVPNLQVFDIDGDGFALSSRSAELRWTVPRETALLYLERQVVGVDRDFIGIGSFPAMVSGYKDTSVIPGYTHRYRLRAADRLGNLSGYSIVAEVYPFEPVDEILWLRDAGGGAPGFRFFFDPPQGSFHLTPILEAETVSGETVITLYPPDLPSLFLEDGRGDEEVPRLFNKTLVLEASNRDGSLVYRSAFPLPSPSRKELLRAGNNLSLKVVQDPSGSLHGVVQRDATLWYFTGKEPPYIWIPLEPGGYVSNQLGITVDTGGGPHIVYQRNGTQELVYTSKGGGTWITEAITTVTDFGPLPTIIAHPQEGVLVFYRSGSPYTLFASKRVAPGSWVTTPLTPSSNEVMNLAASLDGEGAIHLAFVTPGAPWFTLFYRRFSGGVWGVTEAVATDNIFVPSLAVTASTEGTPHLVSVTYPTGELRAFIKGGGGWSSLLLANPGSPYTVFQNPAVSVMDREGKRYLFVSYQDSDRKDLLFARWISETGTLLSYPLDISGSAGWWNSLIVEPSGWVRVFYDDRDLNALKEVRFPWKGGLAFWQGEEGIVDDGLYPGPENTLTAEPGFPTFGVYFNYGFSPRCPNPALCFTSGDEGGVWRSEPVVTLPGPLDLPLYPRAQTLSAGSIHVIYAQNQTLYYARKVGGVWSTTNLNGTNPRGFRFLKDQGERLHLLYGDQNGDLFYTTWDFPSSPTTWEKISTSLDTGVAALAIHPLGNTLYTAYSTTDGVYLLVKESSGWLPPVRVDPEVNFCKGISLKVLPSGQLLILYVGSSSSGTLLNLAYGTLPSLTVIRGEALPLTPYLEVGEDGAGLPVLLYQKGTILRYGSLWEGSLRTSTLISTLPVASFSSALDPEGLSHILYFESANYDLRYLKGRMSERIQAEWIVQR